MLPYALIVTDESSFEQFIEHVGSEVEIINTNMGEIKVWD